MSSEEVIKLFLTKGNVFVWNAKDVDTLRSHGIVGHFVGSLPRNPHQSSLMGLPLKLMNEEVSLLLEKGLAVLRQRDDLVQKPTEETRQWWEELKEKNYEEQVVAAAEHRKHEIVQMADKILEGKQKKLQITQSAEFLGADDVLTKEKVIEIHCAKIQPLQRRFQVIQIFVEHPIVFKGSSVDWNFPNAPHECLRYRVFKDLWERGHYLTSGLKFGCDFLAYKGDPLRFHSIFMVLCVEDGKQTDIHDLANLSRLGSATKKTIVLASVMSDGTVTHKSIQWKCEEKIKYEL